MGMSTTAYYCQHNKKPSIYTAKHPIVNRNQIRVEERGAHPDIRPFAFCVKSNRFLDLNFFFIQHPARYKVFKLAKTSQIRVLDCY